MEYGIVKVYQDPEQRQVASRRGWNRLQQAQGYYCGRPLIKFPVHRITASSYAKK